MKTRSPSPSPSRQGLWSAVADAVRDGWGSTARMLLILAVRGGIVIVALILGAHLPVVDVLRTLMGLR